MLPSAKRSAASRSAERNLLAILSEKCVHILSTKNVASSPFCPRSRCSLGLVPRALLGLVSLLLGNAFIVGINQIYDVDIDKVREPDNRKRSAAYITDY